jgi:hypothetical protein
MTDTPQLKKPKVVTGDPKTLTLLDINARYMTSDQFGALVANVKRDGCLTSLPLVWNDADTGKRIVLSGNHRTKASIAAGLDEIDWLEIDEPLPRQRQIALQLSHNSISGQDDPAILKTLWEEIESIEYREYAALDDKTLELLEKVDLTSLGEANLDYLTAQIIFLPHEVERAQAMFATVKELMQVDARWAAAEEDWGRLVDALDSSRGAHDVVNTAAAFTVMLDVFEAHLDDLRDGWFDPADGGIKHDKWIPVESLLGTRRMPAESAAIVAQAMDKMKRQGDLGPDMQPWRALEFLAAEYLAGP